MIQTLKINHIRNLSQLNLTPSRCNVIIGHNGSGKTSILEALFLLSRGKSFRTHQPKRYIQHHQQAGTVFAEFDDNTRLAIQKHPDASTLLKLNGDTVKTQSQMTKYMPTLLIDPSSMDILEQGSASRRQLLDWLVFHIEPDFYPQWLAYQRILKQRNSLLKQYKSLNNMHLQQIQAWDMGLASHAQLIHHYRQTVFNQWLPHFTTSVKKLLPAYATGLSVSYQAGFDTQTSLSETLAQRLKQDLQQGYTRIGSHRADMHVFLKEVGRQDDKINHKEGYKPIKEQAVNVLSRGEKKLLITALRLSQLPLLQEYHQQLQANHQRYETSVPIVLLDDVTAELDDNAILVLLTTLASLDCQVFITSLTEDILPQVSQYWQDWSVFRLAEGEIQRQS